MSCQAVNPLNLALSPGGERESPRVETVSAAVAVGGIAGLVALRFATASGGEREKYRGRPDARIVAVIPNLETRLTIVLRGDSCVLAGIPYSCRWDANFFSMLHPWYFSLTFHTLGFYPA